MNQTKDLGTIFNLGCSENKQLMLMLMENVKDVNLKSKKKVFKKIILFDITFLCFESYIFVLDLSMKVTCVCSV